MTGWTRWLHTKGLSALQNAITHVSLGLAELKHAESPGQ